MKVLYTPTLTLLLVLVTTIVNAQLKIPVDTATHKVSYTEIVYVDSVSKNDLFSRSLEWIAINYKSANQVIELKDEQAGKIIVKGNFSIPVQMGLIDNDIVAWHMLNITCKDGRCRIQLTGWSYKYCWGGGLYSQPGCREGTFEEKIKEVSEGDMFKKAWIRFFEDADIKAHALLDSYSDFLQNPKHKQEDW